MKSFLALTLLLLSFSIFGQSDMSSQVEAITELVSTVETGKYNISQIMTVEDSETGLASFKYEQIDSKGKTETLQYDFYLGILDHRSIKRNSKKDEMNLTVNSKAGNFILRTENNESAKYIDELKFICQDVDAARDLEKILKELLEKTEDNWKAMMSFDMDNNALSNKMSELSNWKYAEDDKDYAQSMSIVEDGILDFRIVKANKDGEDISNTIVNIADVHSLGVKVSTNGSKVKLRVQALNDEKRFKYSEDDKVKFLNKFDLEIGTLYDAFQIAGIWKAIHNNLKKMEQDYNCQDCFATLKTKLEGFPKKDESIDVQGDQCAVKLDRKTEKSGSTIYDWHWGDVDASSVQLKYNSNSQELSFKTINKMKFIESKPYGDVRDYDNSFDIEILDVESSRNLPELVKILIENCQREIGAANEDWILEQVSSTEVEARYEQKMTKDEECSYEFVWDDTEKGKSNRFNFNLYDINNNMLELEISKGKIGVELNTKRKEKVIMKVDHNKKLSYTNQVKLYFPDLASARTAKSTLYQMAEACDK